jgi:hypothetical protein
MSSDTEDMLKNTLLGTALISSGSLAYAVHNLGKRKLLLQRWGISQDQLKNYPLISQKFKQASYDTFIGKIPRIPGIQISTLKPTQNELNTLLAIRNNDDIHFSILDFQDAIFKSNGNFLITSKRYTAPFVLVVSNTTNPYPQDFLTQNKIKSASTVQMYSTSFPLYYEEFSFNNNEIESGPEYFTYLKLLEIRNIFLNLLFSKINTDSQDIKNNVENLKNNIHLFIYSQEPKKLNNTVVESHIQFDVPNLMSFLNSNITLPSQDVPMKNVI